MPISRSEGREEIVSAKYVGYDSERGCKSRMGTLRQCTPHTTSSNPRRREGRREKLETTHKLRVSLNLESSIARAFQVLVREGAA